DREAGQSFERSPWVRVSEGWAGAGWGMIASPRVGQEVLVSFLEGDPDQPVVVGRAYDASAPPPYPLPAGAMKSVWRSLSSPASGGYHEIAFDDRRDNELVNLMSERDLEKVVVNDQTESAGGDLTASIGGQQSATITGDDSVTVGTVYS